MVTMFSRLWFLEETAASQGIRSALNSEMKSTETKEITDTIQYKDRCHRASKRYMTTAKITKNCFIFAKSSLQHINLKFVLIATSIIFNFLIS